MHRYNPKTDCKSVRINNDQLEQIALRAIATQCSLLDAKVQTIKRESSSAKSSDQILRSECQSLHRQIDRIQADKMALYERYACGNITKEEYALEKNSLSAREEELKAKELIKRIVVRPDKSIRIEWNFSDELSGFVGFPEIRFEEQAI